MSSASESLDRPLPEAVRQHVVELAADILGGLPADEIPAPLRRVARFEPRRRSRLGAAPIAAQLEVDEAFRDRVAESIREAWPELVARLSEGVVPAAADPILVAAAAFLLRPPGWTSLVSGAREELERATAAAEGSAAEKTAERLREQLTAAKAAARSEADRLREQVRAARSDNADLRRKLHDARERARQADRSVLELSESIATERDAFASAASANEAEMRRLKERLAEAERQLEAFRRASREGRSQEDARVRVLLDALSDAAAGLRRELALPSTIHRPADAVEAVGPGALGPGRVPARALSDDDPALLDQLFVLPQLHIIVDGYNVTKAGYGSLPLADQRARLLSGLGGLAAQTRAEITCVFDGAELSGPVPVAAPRGVRVMFSAPGEIADLLIMRLVRAEPTGRAVVVFSSDREVADSVRRAGARPVPSVVLLRRLGRA